MDAAGQLPGMDAARLHLAVHGPVTEVRHGNYTITAYRNDDLGLRNLAICALTESGVSGNTAAGLFGMTAVQISRIRGAYRRHGAAGLARRRGRPPSLTPAQVRQARSEAGAGVTHGEIARRLKVSRPLIVALPGQHGPLYPQGELPGTAGRAGQAADGTAEHPGTAPQAGDDQAGDDQAAAAAGDDQAGDDQAAAAAGDQQAGDEQDQGVAAAAGDQQAGEDQEEERGGAAPARPYHCQPASPGAYRSRYAGAMLTHAFTTAIGAAGILAAGCGLDGADAAADLAVLNATAMGFTLGALTLEQAKHLQSRDAGLLTGLSQLPGERAWRSRLGTIGDRAGPLALQRRMTAALLGHLPPAHQVFLADDHIAGYTGSKPVSRGRNPRRGKATKGHDDTYVCDLAGRALVFASGEPSGLSLTLPPVLAQLTAARNAAAAATGGSSRPDRPVVVFDRGGSYPKTFTAVHAAGYHWISWRRAPLAATGMLPVCAVIRQYGQDRHIAFTDEVTGLDGYPEPVRQVSLFEHGAVVAQLLTSDLELCAGALPGLLRSRWIIENFLKYNAANYGIDTLADYTADLADDTRLTANPAYEQAKKAEQAAAAALAGAQTHLARMLADPGIPAHAKNATLIPAAQKKITACEGDLAAATARRKTLRSKIPRNQLHPGVQRALLRPGRRLLQLVLRLLAANAEQHLADHLNVYLHDDEEYRAITRETILRGLGGTITYTTAAITVTLERPSQPRVTRALACLLAEINTSPPVIPGDRRPITYSLAGT
jgi:hypothetical protein